MKDLIPITLWMADRGYRVRIKPSEEETVRLAVKIAEQRFKSLKINFAGKDNQDFLAMLVLLYATDYVDQQAILNPVTESKIQQLILDIDKIL